MYDVLIIGAGVTGSAIAMELSKYEMRICVVEACEDVCEGTSKANSAIIHAGFDAQPGTLKAKLNVKGNSMMDILAKRLDIPFRRNGTLVLCFSEKEMYLLEELVQRGIKNGVPGLKILDTVQLHKIEPNITNDAIAALYAPTGGIVCPFRLNIAMAENACENGVIFMMGTSVISIERNNNGYEIKTDKGSILSKIVINAAGLYGDEIHNMISTKKVTIIPRKGEYSLFDKAAGRMVDKTVFTLPGKLGKGVLVTPTIHGNLLVGPTAEDIVNKEASDTTADGLDSLVRKGLQSVPKIQVHKVITSFAGLRAHLIQEKEDFIIGEIEDAKNFIDVIGIESPGLTSAPAIGEYVSSMIFNKLSPQRKINWISNIKGVPNLAEMSIEQRRNLIEQNRAYGNMVCRCEKISEGEILDAIHRPLGARTLDGIKRRTRAGMGRCQGGFCTPKILEILARELNINADRITKCGKGSEIIIHDEVL